MDTNAIFIDINKWIIDINKWIIDINKQGLNVKTAAHRNVVRSCSLSHFNITQCFECLTG